MLVWPRAISALGYLLGDLLQEVLLNQLRGRALVHFQLLFQDLGEKIDEKAGEGQIQIRGKINDNLNPHRTFFPWES